MFEGNGTNFFAWGLLTLVAIVFIVMGIQGSAGRMLAVALIPRELIVDTSNFDGSSTGSASF